MLPKDKLSFYRRIRGLSFISTRSGGATKLVHAVLSLWLKNRFPRLSRASLTQTQTLVANPHVIAFAEWLAGQDLLDAAFWLSSAYASWVGDQVRQERAMFFTPPDLAVRLIDDVERNGADFERSIFMDPACGGAAFLAPVAIRIRAALKKKHYGPARIIRHIETHVVGIDLDPTLCQLSAFFLKMALYEDVVAAGREPQCRVRSANALNALGKHSFVSLAANQNIKKRPPYDYLSKLTTLKNLDAHCIPTDPELWRPENFGEFCSERRRLLAKAMNSYMHSLKE